MEPLLSSPWKAKLAIFERMQWQCQKQSLKIRSSHCRNQCAAHEPFASKMETDEKRFRAKHHSEPRSDRREFHQFRCTLAFASLVAQHHSGWRVDLGLMCESVA